jgi:hypothetical protein
MYTHKILQVAVSIINKFMEADGKHDALSNKEVAEKMNEAGFASQVKEKACVQRCIKTYEHASCTHIVDMRARTHTHTLAHTRNRIPHTHSCLIYIQEVFDALDDNGNGRLSAKELRNGNSSIHYTMPGCIYTRYIYASINTGTHTHSGFHARIQGFIHKWTRIASIKYVYIAYHMK